MRRMRRVGLKPQTTKPQGKPMLKRIALAALFVVSAAFAGVGVAKAQSSGAKANTIEVAPKAPQGFCFPAGTKC
jgi:hypothetical protein